MCAQKPGFELKDRRTIIKMCHLVAIMQESAWQGAKIYAT